MPGKGKYRCTLCGWISDPEAKNEKRSASMHVNKQHSDEIPEDAEASEYWVRNTESPSNEEVKTTYTGKGKTQKKPDPENLIYIVQAEFPSKFEAGSEKQTLLQNKPDFEDFTYQEDKFLLIKCSSEKKAEFAQNAVKRFTEPIDIGIKEERKPRDTKNSFLSKLNVFSGIFSGSTGNGNEKETDVKPPKEVEGKLVAKTTSADNYKHFQQTEADSSTMEGLMMTRQQIAKGEAMGGHDPMKWVVAIIVLLIGLGVAWMIFKGQGIGALIPSGGGGGTIIP